jgi:hypothetical protein
MGKAGKSSLVAPIPVPVALPLFISALGGMGLINWHRKWGSFLAMEDVKMLSDKRLWYAVAAVIVLILIGLYRGSFRSGGEPDIAPTEQQEVPAQAQ